MATSPPSTTVRAQLDHVYWMGGGSGAGKSTTARRIAGQQGMHVYATDDMMSDHAERTTPQDAPLLSEFKGMDMDERWVSRSPQAMLENFPWFCGEGFSLVIEDLLRLPKEPKVIVEGFRLLPRLVEPLLATPSHAGWLLPTPEFRRVAFEARGSAWEIAHRTSDPERAQRNLLERDRMFTNQLYEDIVRLQLRFIMIDRGMSEDHLTRQITKMFEL